MKTAYRGWKTNLEVADLVDAEPGNPAELTPSAIEEIREQTRSTVRDIVDSMTAGLVESAAFDAEAYAGASQALSDARAISSSAIEPRISLYSEAGELAFEAMSGGPGHCGSSEFDGSGPSVLDGIQHLQQNAGPNGHSRP